MRYLLNAFSPTMLNNFRTCSVVFRPFISEKDVFSNILKDGVNALNPRHTSLFDSLRDWGAVPPKDAINVSLKIGDDAMIILPRNQNRTGSEIQTSTPNDYQFIWCGILPLEYNSTPVASIFEYAGGDMGRPWFDSRTLESVSPTDMIEISYGCEWEISGVAVAHCSPSRVFRGTVS